MFVGLALVCALETDVRTCTIMYNHVLYESYDACVAEQVKLKATLQEAGAFIEVACEQITPAGEPA
jgi:hypothetical protein